MVMKHMRPKAHACSLWRPLRMKPRSGAPMAKPARSTTAFIKSMEESTAMDGVCRGRRANPIGHSARPSVGLRFTLLPAQYQTMQAAVLHGRADLRVEEVTPAALRTGEVRGAIQAALTCGTDLKVCKRGSHARMIVPPALFGHEFAGRICEVAQGAEGWRVGDRVVAANSAPCGECFFCQNGQENLCDALLFLNGAYAESIAVPARLVRSNLLRLAP